MATPVITRSILETEDDRGFIKAVWSLTTADATGDMVPVAEYNDKVWTIANGPSDALGGSTTSLRGINRTGDTPVVLNKAAGGTAATAAAAAVISTIENTLFVAPTLTTPGGGAIVTVTLFARRSNILRN